MAWLRYNVPGRPLWHQRLILGSERSLNELKVIVTPDGDVYFEDMRVSADIRQIVYETLPGVLPAEVRGADLYRFDALPAGRQLARLVARADEMIVAELALLPAAAAEGRPPRQPRLPVRGGVAEEEPAGRGRRPDAPRPLRTPPGTPPRSPPREDRRAAKGDWVAAEDCGQYKVGDTVKLRGAELIDRRGEKGLYTTSAGETVFVMRLQAGETVEKFRASRLKDGGSDARVLAVAYNATGTRHRLWRDLVTKLDTVVFGDWPLPGPRTAVWCAQFIDLRGGSPMDHHRWWLANLRLNPTDFGVQEHEHGMRAFQFFGEYDQLDLSNVVGLEVILRRCQVIEFHYEKKGKNTKEKDVPAGISREEAAYFSGTHRLAGEVMISPELVDWVTKEIGRDVEVTKQMRKAREENRLSRPEK